VSELSPRGAIPSPPPAGSIDAQILATWHALLVNPDLDPCHALCAIDQLLDQRAGDAASPTTPAAPLTHPVAGTSAERSVIAELLTILLCAL
jgi:hypothetical protein